eukprot:scaffold421228_cov49-Attheya_sp.AAC.2
MHVPFHVPKSNPPCPPHTATQKTYYRHPPKVACFPNSQIWSASRPRICFFPWSVTRVPLYQSYPTNLSDLLLSLETDFPRKKNKKVNQAELAAHVSHLEKRKHAFRPG